MTTLSHRFRRLLLVVEQMLNQWDAINMGKNPFLTQKSPFQVDFCGDSVDVFHGDLHEAINHIPWQF